MKNYRIVLKSINGEDKVKCIYEERIGKYYKRMNGKVPLELKKISEKNEEFILNFKLNKLELKVYL